MIPTKTLTAGLVAATMTGAFALPAAAEGLYYGIGAGYTSATSDADGGGASSDADFGNLGGTLGYRWDRGAGFYGAEADLDLSLGSDFEGDIGDCDAGADGPYYCNTSGTLRLRGIAGTDIGNGYELFGTLGFAAVQGEAAVGPTEQDSAMNTGYTVGMGLQKRTGKGMTHRVELVYDNLDSASDEPSLGGTSYEPEYEQVSLNYRLLFGN